MLLVKEHMDYCDIADKGIKEHMDDCDIVDKGISNKGYFEDGKLHFIPHNIVDDQPVKSIGISTNLEFVPEQDEIINIPNDIKMDEKRENEGAISSLVTPFIVRKKRRFTLSYELIIWIVFIAITIVALMDRFAMGGDWLFGRQGNCLITVISFLFFWFHLLFSLFLVFIIIFFLLALLI